MNPIEKTVYSLDWMTLVLFISMLIFALGKYFYHNKFLNFVILPFNDKYVLLHNKKGQLFNWFHILLTAFQAINLALFIFLALKAFDAITIENQLNTFLWVLAFLILFQIAKLALQFIKGFVFNTQGLISELVFSKTSYLNHSSILLFISNVILVYIFRDSKMIIYTTIILILLVNGIGVIKLLKNYQKAMFPYFVYFILYLCALEIAPLVIIGSYLKD
ncbi:DUF4271 domain-containing protein [Muricauda sp. CAU 1633]|uniref:DUF4271 domain-containing protein n=1 Tax=Allomuricauda sp. CAU 1633 TaxID=2816036 RepID=UPI001A8C44A4|nr:DUF4271 domain-containing protein [Muricauda sp. CAU 1633]MBO0321329.1 DUF4271 domain-containing protein [Muricauda sp. CAU 1633]